MAEKPLPKVSVGTAKAVVAVKLEQSQFKSIERLVLLMTNISDNLYNIAGFMGAQLTSLKQTEEALKAMVPKEGEARETALEEQEPDQLQRKEISPLQRLIDFFDNLTNILIPFLVGFVIGLKKEFGLIAALVLVFRKQIVSTLKELPKVISFMAGFLKTAITGAINSLSKAFNVVKLEFRGVLVAYSSQIEKISKFFSKITSGLKSISSLSKLVDTFVDAGRAVFNAIANVGKKFTALIKAFAAGAEAASVFGKFLGKIGSFASSFAKFLGPIGAAIAIVTSLFTAFKQAFKGFDEEGIFGAIKGFTSGLITGLVGWIGDLGTWLLSKLLGMLGFEELAAKIGEFDFSESLNTAIQTVFDVVKNFIMSIPEMISTMFSNLGEAIKGVFNFDFADLSKKLLNKLAPPGSFLGNLFGTEETGEQAEGKPAKWPPAEWPPDEVMEGKSKGLAPAEVMEGKSKGLAPAEVMEGKSKGLAPAEVMEGKSPGLRALPQQPAAGQALASESQKVAGAAQKQSAPGASQNVVAPTTTVNQSSSQNLSITPTAAPMFGMQASSSELRYGL